MSTTTPRTAVTARIDSQNVEQLRQLADERDTTVSRLINRAVADKLAAARAMSDEPFTDDLNDAA
jgi:predicted transcriptional regulator